MLRIKDLITELELLGEKHSFDKNVVIDENKISVVDKDNWFVDDFEDSMAINANPQGIRLNIKGDGNTNSFINMLAWIEVLGNVGHSSKFEVFADGDGRTRFKFDFKSEEMQEKYEQLKREMVKENINKQEDFKYFEI